jgi:hypothetical protein
MSVADATDSDQPYEEIPAVVLEAYRQATRQEEAEQEGP